MVFFTLLSHKLRALDRLREFERIAENCIRRDKKLPVKLPLVVRIRLLIAVVFPPAHPRPKPAPDNFYQRIFHTGTRENDAVRLLSTFMLCQIVGILFFLTMAIKYATFPGRMGTYIGLITQLTMSLLMCFPGVRCWLLLAVPSLITSKLRAVILLFVLIWCIQVSAMNTTGNIQQAVEAMSCVQVKIARAAEESRQEANKELDKLSDKIQALHAKIMAPINKLRDALRKMKIDFTQFGAEMKSHFAMFAGLTDDCKRELLTPHYACSNAFDAGYEMCMDKFSYVITDPETGTVEWICGILGKLKNMCNVSRLIVGVCEIPAMVKESLSSGMLSFVKEAIDRALDFVRNNFAYKIYKDMKNDSLDLFLRVNHTFKVDSRWDSELRKARDNLKAELKTFEIIIQIFSWMLNLLVIPLMIQPFIMSAIYLLRFTRGEMSDNHYINDEFLRIDEARDTNKQMTLWPLMPSEIKQYLRPWSLKMIRAEKLLLFVRLVTTVLSSFVPMFIIGMDIAVYRLLREAYLFFSSDNTRIETPNFYKLKMAGNGFAAEILDGLLQIFEPLKRELARDPGDDTWHKCFVEPNPPDVILFQIMFLLYIFAILLCILQVYTMRLRHHIAEYYYPNRVRPRALFIYAKMLDSRRTLLDRSLQAAKKKRERNLAKELALDELAGRDALIKAALPHMSIEQYVCVRCTRGDLASNDDRKTRICVNCNALYCTDCYTVRRSCMDCHAKLQILYQDVEFVYDSSCDEEDQGDEQ